VYYIFVAQVVLELQAIEIAFGILQPKLMEKLSTLMRATDEKWVDLTEF